MSKCKDCGQPMLPKGAVKRPNEYDHAQGCPRAPKPSRAILIAAAVAAERQACAKIAEGQMDPACGSASEKAAYNRACADIAAAIRARTKV